MIQNATNPSAKTFTPIIWIRSLIWKYWYRLVTRLMKKDMINFMNYGYTSLEDGAPQLSLESADEPNRLFIQLYHQAASQIDLAGLDVLEVSSGHGGGASFVARYHKPKSYLGLDRTPSAVSYSQQHYDSPNLSYTLGDAQALRFADHSFDAVLNIEASHSYGDQSRFLSEVYRVLRPGGHFLITDFRNQAAHQTLLAQVAAAGFKLAKQADITANVLKSMRLLNQERLQLIAKIGPRPLHKLFQQFTGVEGSHIFEAFRTGEYIYFTYALAKPAA